MASVADIIINVTANAASAVNGLNQIQMTAQQTATKAGGALTNMTNNVGARINSAGDRITKFGQNIKKSIGTDAALAFGVAGAAATTFMKQCVDAAIRSESSWTRFGALVNGAGGNWEANTTKIKGFVRTHANEMGYAVSDAREAASTILQAGFSYDQLGAAMQGVGALAARTGRTEAEASQLVTAALSGRFTQLTKLTGLQKEQFMDANGNIDRMKLLTALYEQNAGAVKAHGETTEAAINRMNNAWGSFKVGIGQALLPVIQMLAGFAETVVSAFNGLPGPIKTIVAVFITLGGAIGVGLGALGLLAPALINVGTMIKTVTDASKLFSAALKINALFVRVAQSSMMGDTTSKVANILATNADASANITLSGALRLAATAFLQLAAAILTNPITWIAIAVIALVAIMWHLYNTNAEVKKGLDDLANAIKGGVMVVFNGLKAVVDTLWAGVVRLGQAIYTNLVPVWQNVQKMAAPIIPVFRQLYFALQNLWNALNGGGGDDAAGSFNVLAAAGQAVGAVILALVNNIAMMFQTIAAIAIPVITLLISSFSILINGVSNVINIFNLLANGQIDVGTAFKLLLQNIINVMQGIGGAVMTAGRQILTNLTAVFGNIPAAAGSALAALPATAGAVLMGFVTSVQTRFNQARAYAIQYITNLRLRALAQINVLVLRVRLYFANIANNIRLYMLRAFTNAVLYANQIKNNLIQKFNQAVQRVKNYISNIPSTIRSRLSTAASNALSGARQIYDNIINKIKEIPQQVANELSSLPGKISSALSSAAASALSGAAGIVRAFANGLQRASPGKIYKDTLDEFSHVVGVIQTKTPEAATKTEEMAKKVVEQWQNNLPNALNVPGAMFQKIPSFNIGLNTDDINLLSSNLQLQRDNLNGVNNSITNNRRDEHRTIIVEHVNLQCNDLTREESRRVLYNALDGLYTGGA